MKITQFTLRDATINKFNQLGLNTILFDENRLSAYPDALRLISSHLFVRETIPDFDAEVIREMLRRIWDDGKMWFDEPPGEPVFPNNPRGPVLSSAA